MLRRGVLRRHARIELGNVPERAEAVAAAVDSVVNGWLYGQIQAEADRIQQQAAADLAKGEALPVGTAAPHLPDNHPHQLRAATVHSSA